MESSEGISTISITGLPTSLRHLRGAIASLCHDLLNAHRVKSYSISIAFVDDAKISALNRQALGREGATDVIAFDLSEEGLVFDKVGDIYISIDQVRSNSAELSIGEDEELIRLVIHGMLHILGYRDSTPSARKEMFEIQESQVRRFLERELRSKEGKRK